MYDNIVVIIKILNFIFKWIFIKISRLVFFFGYIEERKIYLINVGS